MNSALRIVKVAAFAAIICISTMLIVIPLPGNGYANLGDTMVIAAGFFLGPLYGATAAAVGSGIADLLSGFAAYAPATFIIKGIMALAVGVICSRVSKPGFSPMIIPASLASEALMIGGYFAYEAAILDLSIAAVDLMGNGVQGMASVLLSVLLVSLLNANKNIRKLIKI